MEQLQFRYNVKSSIYDSWLAMMEGERNAFRKALTEFGLNGYDLIHAQDVISAIAISEVKAKEVPLVITLHGKLSTEFHFQGAIAANTPAWLWANALDYYGRMSGDRVIVPSQWLKRQYSQVLVSEEAETPIDVIPYGFDTISYLRQSSGIRLNDKKEGVKLVVCPARLDAVKGHHVLLQALSLLLKRRSDWVCWLVGDGAMREQLEQSVDQLNLRQYVMFLGHRSDVPILLKEADCVVLPSIHDNLPFSIMEAQVSGKPIIAADTGGIPEMITHKENGLLFPSGRSDLLCHHIDTLFNDHNLRNRIANEAKRSGIKKWSLNAMIDRIAIVYGEAIRTKRGRKR